jgi:hypothetical protein
VYNLYLTSRNLILNRYFGGLQSQPSTAHNPTITCLAVHLLYLLFFPSGRSTGVENPRQIGPFVAQNKPNFRKAQTNVNSTLAKDYENESAFTARPNKPNQTQFQYLPCHDRGQDQAQLFANGSFSANIEHTIGLQ